MISLVVCVPAAGRGHLGGDLDGGRVKQLAGARPRAQHLAAKPRSWLQHCWRAGGGSVPECRGRGVVLQVIFGGELPAGGWRGCRLRVGIYPAECAGLQLGGRVFPHHLLQAGLQCGSAAPARVGVMGRLWRI